MTNENQPVHGRRGKEKQSQRQIEIEDALKHFLACEEAGNALSSDSLSGVLQIRREDAALVLEEMRERRLAEPNGDVWCLTEKGKQLALEMVRRHRLYETFLAREKGVPADQWHSQADTEEHRMDGDATNALANRLGNPRFDPHGDPIPTREGDLPVASRVSLVEWDVSEPAMIDHIEDEPVPMHKTRGQINNKKEIDIVGCDLVVFDAWEGELVFCRRRLRVGQFVIMPSIG